MERVLVTGADGFVGQAVSEALEQRGDYVRRVVRRPLASGPGAGDTIAIGDVGGDAAWPDALAGIDAVVHLAARVHVLSERVVDPLAAFRRVNVEGTRRLAVMAAKFGVRQLIYTSSIGVNGASTSQRPFTEADPPAPTTPYARSKWEAEQALAAVAAETGLDVVVLRPPMVYGPGVKGNCLSLVRAIDRGFPLPLSGVHNARSLLHVGNLASAIVCCMGADRAAGQTYLVRDGEDVSTPVLVRRLAEALGRRPRLWFCPSAVLRAAARIERIGRRLDQLTGSLVIDDTKIHDDLGWMPPFSLGHGLQRMADWYRHAARPHPRARHAG